MKEAKFADYELGNLIFGNSRGRYAVHPREEYQDVFCDFLHDNGFDHYGHNDNGDDCYETDTFIIRPYYWGEDETIADLPNFVYKPTGLEICWYKYPMRNAFSNKNISVKELKKILKACSKSMKEARHGRVD